MTNHLIVCMFVATATFAAIAADPGPQAAEVTVRSAPALDRVAVVDPQIAEDSWSADESAGGTRPDFAH